MMKKHEIEKPPTFTKIKEGWIVGCYQADSTKYEVVAIPVVED